METDENQNRSNVKNTNELINNKQNELLCPDATYPLASSDIIEPIKKINFNNKKKKVTYIPITNNYEEYSIFGLKLSETQITAMSGALAGFVSGVIVCPLDVAKTRLQAQGLQSRGENKYYRGLYGTLSTIVRDEGPKGLYKGLVPILMGYLPTWMIYFSVYEFCKTSYPQIFHKSDFVSHSCSAITAGAISTIITNPIWVIKTRLMLQTDITKNSTHYKGTFDAFKKIYTQEGVKALYSGLVPSFIGLFHVAIHFPVFEKLKVMFNYKTITNTDTNLDFINGNNKNHQLHRIEYSINLNRLILASCISKMIASVITYPHEILRTRMQLKSDLPSSVQHKIIPLIKKTYAQEGFKGFYSGFSANLIRTVPASAITLVSFEYVRNLLSNLGEEPR
ncbi:hypothetical protein Kpol_312p2 [Vanderwaltozyma polyspora DSM 70294]|uniref:Mitochondrial nicotinamide adenine dinucleotide transporter 1 n=1 Tax=Vanderwaltozyma polyspora (strain ATCC 22028 / DSM 70294 / BCRC 21397 / CBS 2163 / NBRC 10782 / NRRL Y-8283 / UCD 57-17) TaxID=436907 RepID=A7TSI6_VANPO|nr:uncharacterized protein Kpol_312p2 [Vanderwaltozyma polyspora DSM 70294]EDO14764.1 hypothetical protein Kpol_312p2 [Vanderwaltozyma polyspora DSM 70294]